MKLEVKKENFVEWYNEIIEMAELIDKRYPIKGMHVWRPYGWKLVRNLDNLIRRVWESTGHKEVNFPTLIPYHMFEKEAEHIRGFGGQVYWVTRAGDNELEEPYILRPTSETAMYTIFSLWIRSHADLPLKTFQIVNVFRYETKQTRSFIRMREFHFYEAHTCHRDYEDAERQIREDMEMWEEIAKKVAIPYILCRRPDWDKFPGAEYTLGADTLMPTGRALQIATMHQYGQNFSRPYEIKYLKEDGTHEYVHQTTFGISERLIGAIVGIHGDDKGLILPPEIAPIQVVIVPIPGEGVMEFARKVRDILSSNFRVHMDDREDYTPGYKYNDWEMRGVPIRVEIGPREVEENSITIVARDERKRIKVSVESMVERIREELENLEKRLYDKAKRIMKEMIKEFDNLDELKEHKGMGIIYWCGSMRCAEEIEIKTEKKILGYPVGERHAEGKCIVCGKNTSNKIYVAKTY